MDSFIFIGGDSRMLYAAQRLGRAHLCGFQKLTPCTGLYNDGRLFDCAVLPVQKSSDGVNIPCPLSDILIPYTALYDVVKEGGIVFTGYVCEALEKVCTDSGFALVNYLENEELALRNAVLTAEGVLPVIINELPYSVFGTEMLITGYGRIAGILAEYLKAMGAKVTIACRKPEARARAEINGCKTADITVKEEFQTAISASPVIINTVPEKIFGEEEITAMKNKTLYIELASADGINGDIPDKVRVITARGLPGKVSPVTAGEIIADAISFMSVEERRGRI